MEPILSTDSWVEKLNKLYSDSLFHFGVGPDDNPPGRGSGRYPKGDGERAFQRQNDLYARYKKNLKAGMSEKEIAKAMGFYLTYPNSDRPILDENGDPQGNVSLLRKRISYAHDKVREEKALRAMELRETIDPETGKFYTNKKIGELLSDDADPIGESTVRSWVKGADALRNARKTDETINRIKDLVDSGKLIDVGPGAELELGVSPDKLKTALQELKEQGYNIYYPRFQQVGMLGQFTTTTVVCPPDVQSVKDVYKRIDDIKPVTDPEGQSLSTLLGTRDPVKVAMSRIDIKYKEDGGADKDGVVEIRAVRDANGNLVAANEDLSLGNAKYAQVRIAVEGDKYIKGMAVYNEDLPKGVDILVNSNKSVKDGVDEALKSMKEDKDNPFGTTVWQSEYAPGKLSAINIVSDMWGVDKHVEGAWDEWSRNLPSQFLSKQSEPLIKQQLKLKVQEKQAELDEIRSIENPTVRKKLLIDFADGCDASAEDLKAAALPGQRVQVLLPVNSLKDNECYAPNYDNGTTVALIRFPHTGPFEIPILKVNNSNQEAKSFLKDARGEAKDAIGITKNTAQVLSGADFDGDTAIVIPLTRKDSQGNFEKTVNIKGIGNGQQALKGLEGFDPQEAFPERVGMKRMTKDNKGKEMGVITNLITDMSVKGVTDEDELVRAVKYSMVVIDSEKHKLDYTRAYKEYRIQELKDKYQENADGKHGVSTLLSRSTSPVQVEQRQQWQPSKNSIDPETGEKIYKLSENRFYHKPEKVKKLASEEYKKEHPNAKYERDSQGNIVYERHPDTGKIVYRPAEELSVRTTEISRMSKAKDARELLSDNPSSKEIIYADYANKMKSMANESRKEWLATPNLQYNPEARKKYAAEVDSLNDRLVKAKLNAPRERYAQRMATQIVNEKKEQNPDMSKEELKKTRAQELTRARQRTGAHKDRVTFTDKEWEAINAGAISETMLNALLTNADTDSVRSMALPKSSRVSASTATRVKGLLNAGWTRQQIVDAGYASLATVKAVESGNYEH